MTAGVIMAGGAGKRMGALTANSPKVLLMVGGTPLIDYALNCLIAAEINVIYAVVAYQGDLVRQYLADKGVECIYGDSQEHVFYAINRAYIQAPSSVETFVFLDGDTVFEPTLLVNVPLTLCPEYDGLILTTTNFNTGSQWKLTTNGYGCLTTVEHGYCAAARSVIVFRRQIAASIFAYADSIQPMSSWRRENEFLRGFEHYQLGWGLFLGIALHLAARFKVLVSPFPITNINQPTDLQ